jgi:hypothetical protein
MQLPLYDFVTLSMPGLSFMTCMPYLTEKRANLHEFKVREKSNRLFFIPLNFNQSQA